MNSLGLTTYNHAIVDLELSLLELEHFTLCLVDQRFEIVKPLHNWTDHCTRELIIFIRLALTPHVLVSSNVPIQV